MVELSENFKLAYQALDKDHQRLVDMVNSISDMLDSGQTEGCEDKVQEFVNFAKAHFSREEQLLIKAGYPEADKHHEHHQQLHEKMEHILAFAGSVDDNDMARESLKKELVFFLMDDIITTDLEFKDFINADPE